MNLGIKEQVLIAIYKECQKASPNMEAITFISLGIPKEKFLHELAVLDNEGFVNYLRFPGAGARSTHPATVAMRDAKISAAGIEYVETKLLIEELSSVTEDS